MFENMDQVAQGIVKKEALKDILLEEGKDEGFIVFIVWKGKTLQNWKYICSTNLIFDDKLYELTYDGDKSRWYLDTYKKVKNEVIPAE